MKKRYQIGFPKGTSCAALEAMPDWVPVVDMGSSFACGVLVCFAPHKHEAEKIVRALNFAEKSEQLFKDIGVGKV